ncbi:von Willebrand factor A domain-containing protein 5B1-like [Hippocampus comes]|uniref:von Willebrand factor A domain-containing protein 5B1-like n=1 Tax=Hippocampus comes TaxID=109280 RepID=UPI00094EFF54|nr:PREDICTED: von Willebrand factor A domain-containing protein 5B1-like [Hippocampus comes]
MTFFLVFQNLFLQHSFFVLFFFLNAKFNSGLESPTHALRADADPSAQSASATYITLAQEHPYDRHIEIILHLSEPHSPLVIIENGRLSFSQYEQHILSRRDFIRCTRKDPEPERKVEFMRKRYHKDILNNPVLMLNFCPDFLAEPLELNKATREILFLVDWNGGISGTNIRRVKVSTGHS